MKKNPEVKKNRTNLRVAGAALLVGLFLLAPLAASLNASLVPEGRDQTEVLPSLEETSRGIMQQLLDIAGITGDIGIDPNMIDSIALMRAGPTDVIAPQAMVDTGKNLLERFSAITSAGEAVREVAYLNGLEVPVRVDTIPAEPLSTLILRFYTLADIQADVPMVLDLQERVNALDANKATGLAIMVDALNQAIVLEALGNSQADYTATIRLVDAAEQAKPYFQASASAAAACDIWEDPTGLIIIGSECGDTYDDTFRVLQIDPDGNDVYNNRAGGSTASRIPNSDDFVGWSISGNSTVDLAVSPLGAYEVEQPYRNGESLDERLLNFSWLFDRVLDDLLTNQSEVMGSVNNNTADPVPRRVDETTDYAQFVADHMTGIKVTVSVNESGVVNNFPISISYDMNGNDIYTSSDLASHGSSIGGIGILLDDNGDDTYSAPRGFSQASSFLGVGILYDGDGSDTFSSGLGSQASGDGGSLFNLGDGDDSYSALFGSQGGRPVPFPAQTNYGVLYDEGGDDSYLGGTYSQGVGNILIDGGGHDSYTAFKDLSDTLAVAQGGSLAFTHGLLIDAWGNDVYSASLAAQGVGYGNAPAALLDFDGDDTYSAPGQVAQGVCLGFSALLYDGSGDDSYTAGRGQGLSGSQCIAALVDRSGDDTYTASSLAQGVGAEPIIGVALYGVLVDGDGDDTYTSGHSSQGSTGPFGGLGLLVDAYGQDTYTAGHSSQGSGGSGADSMGILIDGVTDAGKVHADYDVDDSSINSQAGVITPLPNAKDADSFTAGDYSQGSSGPNTGVGILIDNADETEGNAAMRISTFNAGSFSQGSGSAYGVGILVNREARDDYVAGANSQGASVTGGAGILVDLAGRDSYTGPAGSSQGYADTNEGGLRTNEAIPEVSIGLLMDGGDTRDRYNGNTGPNGACRTQGDFGFLVDAAPTPSCGAAASDAVTNALALVDAFTIRLVDDADVLTNPGPGTPAPANAIWWDNLEGPNVETDWTVDNGIGNGNLWRIVNDMVLKQPTGPGDGGRSGSMYWYVGSPIGSGVHYLPLSTTSITSPNVTIPAGSNATVVASVAGDSENGFDELVVSYMHNGIENTLDVLSGAGLIRNLNVQTQELSYDLPPSLAGESIQIRFTFTTDEIVETGMGWNVDDIGVLEV